MERKDEEIKQRRREASKEDVSKETEDKKTRRQKREEKKKKKRPIRRIFPIWLRVLIVFLLSFLAVILGLIVGYSIIGGGEPMEVLEFEFWQHLIDIISGRE